MVKANVDAGLTSSTRSFVKATLSELAVGLAFQGSPANFAGGVPILATRPFAVGQIVEANGYVGTVREIEVLYTVLDTPDNRRVVIPYPRRDVHIVTKQGSV